jgi:hypothetical protein
MPNAVSRSVIACAGLALTLSVGGAAAQTPESIRIGVIGEESSVAARR